MIIDSGAGFDDEKSLLMSQMSLEKRFGQSAVFVASTLMENGGVPQSATPDNLLKEAIHVISCGYEDKTEWGSEVSCLYSILEFYVALTLISLTNKGLYSDPFKKKKGLYSDIVAIDLFFLVRMP